MANQNKQSTPTSKDMKTLFQSVGSSVSVFLANSVDAVLLVILKIVGIFFPSVKEKATALDRKLKERKDLAKATGTKVSKVSPQSSEKSGKTNMKAVGTYDNVPTSMIS